MKREGESYITGIVYGYFWNIPITTTDTTISRDALKTLLREAYLQGIEDAENSDE